ncbi:ferredoxin [Roseovarius sp. E0-M6]|uniref:ferredoxin n=1 Tax=Roseovarius sp. E0-M6 TaxID=3127118 RepID=UPI003010122B
MAAVSEEVTYDGVRALVAGECLIILCALHEKGDTVLLLGPGDGFWEMFRDTPEMQDGAPDPMDRWSERVIGRLADTVGSEAVFPFGGPPYQPFLRWALSSGHAWSSPVGMLVHGTAGMMVSFRGALRIRGELDLPPAPETSPCDSCEDKPCLTACPVNALSDAHFYKVEDCHSYLDTLPGAICMKGGCLVRRACPISQSFDRSPAQSALHMRYFHTT